MSRDVLGILMRAPSDTLFNTGKETNVSTHQHTIERPVRARGIGLHSGAAISLKMIPAPPNFGVNFVRTDLSPEVLIPARSEFVVDTQLATSIGVGSAWVGTIEHLMAALAGASVDNVLVELDGPEVPAMDGSAAQFMALLHKAGLQQQSAPRRCLRLVEPIEVSDGDKFLRMDPWGSLRVDFQIDFDHPLIARQSYSCEVTLENFERHISSARTFGFLRDVELLKRNGLALGGSLHNAVVVGDEAVLNVEGLRFPDEFVRHKILDLIGDLALFGVPILARVTASKSGHALHHLLLSELSFRSSAWRYTEQGATWIPGAWDHPRSAMARATA